MSERRPVADWATDFDHLTDEWAARCTDIWAELRERCPVAHTDRYHGAYLVTRYDDAVAVAHDPASFSSRVTFVNENPPEKTNLNLPPVTRDPPDHSPIRRALLPSFNPRKVAELEPLMVAMVDGLLDKLRGREVVDAVHDFAEHVPILIMNHLFGVPAEVGPHFRRWVDDLLKEGQVDIEIARRANRDIQTFFAEQLRQREERPTPDLVTMVLEAQITEEDGTRRTLTERERIGVLFLLLLGGIDTTYSVLGASLYHLASHPEDLAKLVQRPDLMPNAVEEFLRFFAPVTIGRVILDDVKVGDCPMKAGERVLVALQSANRDGAHFERPEEVVLEREHNRHIAFGVGIHRCLGSNLARMELNVALTRWLARFPRFELAVDPSEIAWTLGPIRGPRNVPVRILETRA